MNISCTVSFWWMFLACGCVHDGISLIIYYIKYDMETLIGSVSIFLLIIAFPGMFLP